MSAQHQNFKIEFRFFFFHANLDACPHPSNSYITLLFSLRLENKNLFFCRRVHWPLHTQLAHSRMRLADAPMIIFSRNKPSARRLSQSKNYSLPSATHCVSGYGWPRFLDISWIISGAMIVIAIGNNPKSALYCTLACTSPMHLTLQYDDKQNLDASQVGKI